MLLDGGSLTVPPSGTRSHRYERVVRIRTNELLRIAPETRSCAATSYAPAMGLWTLASIIVLALGAGTVVVMLRDREVPRDEVRGADWLLPTPVDIREPDLGFAWQGYDPRQVDALLDAVAVAYEELLLAAGPSALRRAESRVASRRGREHEVPPPVESADHDASSIDPTDGGG